MSRFLSDVFIYPSYNAAGTKKSFFAIQQYFKKNICFCDYVCSCCFYHIETPARYCKYGRNYYCKRHAIKNIEKSELWCENVHWNICVSKFTSFHFFTIVLYYILFGWETTQIWNVNFKLNICSCSFNAFCIADILLNGFVHISLMSTKKASLTFCFFFHSLKAAISKYCRRLVYKVLTLANSYFKWKHSFVIIRDVYKQAELFQWSFLFRPPISFNKNWLLWTRIRLRLKRPSSIATVV